MEIMKKDSISGEELGMYIIKNDIYTYSGIKVDDNEYPISQENFNILLEKIDDVEDADILECYVQLQSFVQRSQAMANAYNQQAQNGCCRILMYMSQANQVEHARKMIEYLPMIMTESQFRKMRNPGRIARMRGVAVVAENFPCRPGCLDVNDEFIPPEIDCFQEMASLEYIEKMKDRIEYFRNELMIPGVRYHLAYNVLYNLIAERINIDEFTVFCVDSGEIIEQINEINTHKKRFAQEIAGEGEEYANKVRILNDVFREIDIDALYPSDKNISTVREILSDINVFRTSMDQLVEILAGTEG